MVFKGDNFLKEIFSKGEYMEKCIGSLSKLSWNLKAPIVLTGSIATCLNFARRGILRRNSLNDIDIVVEDLACVHASLGKDFLINHFHPFRAYGRVLIQLVDAEHNTRIEIFTPNSKTLSERLTDFVIGNLPCRAVSAEDILAKLLTIVYSLTKGETVDPKYVEHFRLLLNTADLATAREIWQDYRKNDQPANFSKAVRIVEQTILANPNLLRAEEYCQDINFECQWCIESKAFPLASRTKIYKILGYV